MKTIGRLLALVLALALVLSMSACSKAPKLDGVWSYTMDLKKALQATGELDTEDRSAGSEEAQQLQDVLTQMVEGVALKMVLDLKEDGSYTVRIDETSAQAAADAMRANLSAQMPSVLSMMFDVPVDQLDKTLTALGTSMDDMMQSMYEHFNTEELVASIADRSGKGSYRYEEGKLYLTGEGQTEDAAKYLAVELGENELKVTAVNGVEDFKDFEKLTPLVFKK